MTGQSPTLVVKKSSATNQGAVKAPETVRKDGKILHAPRKRVLRPRVDAFIDNRLRKGPTDDVPVAETFVLEGDQEVSIFDEKAVEPVKRNGMVFHVLGVFDLISDTPAVWLEEAKN